MAVALAAVAGFLALLLWLNWGIWRSTAYRLTGVDFPLRETYRTDISERGREAGFFVVVCQLPDDVVDQLGQRGIKLSRYPMLDGLETGDGYTRVNWTNTFPRNDIEQEVFRHFKREVIVLNRIDPRDVRSDDDAIRLANSLIRDPNTLYAGWYKDKSSSGNIWIPHFYFYLLNLEQRTLIMFGLDT